MTPDTTPKARATDPQTSHDAAAHAATLPQHHATPAALTEAERAVLDAFVVFGAMIDEVLVEAYRRWRSHNNWPAQSDSGIRSRRKALIVKGYLAVDGHDTNEAGRKCMKHRALVTTTPKRKERP